MVSGEVTPEDVTDNAPIPLLMTRPRAASLGFLKALPAPIASRVIPTLSPLIELIGLDATVPLDGVAGVVFSSANGVAFAPKGQGQPAFCVGPATTKAAQKKGWDARRVGATSDALVKNMAQDPIPGPLLHLAGVHTRGNIAMRLTDLGIKTRHVALYDQALQELTADAQTLLRGEGPVIVPLFSPRTAKQFEISAKSHTSSYVIALSDTVADALGRAPVAKVVVAQSPDAESLCNAMQQTFWPGVMG